MLVTFQLRSLGIGFSLLSFTSVASESFVNFETAPIHPVALSADGSMLAVCNLPDARVELFDVSSGVPQALASVPVGIDPVSVRFRSSNELWVVNHISSSTTIVDTANRRVVATLDTRFGPADVVFAGSPARAFISCAKEDLVQVFDPIQRQVITNLTILGDRPKALAVSPDGSRVYVAVFESGNASTILSDGAVYNPFGPYAGQAPPPNDGPNLDPPIYRQPEALERGFQYEESFLSGIIVKRNSAGRWMDDNNGDWTEFIRGTNAAQFGRPLGWDMPDRDLAVINTTNFAITYATGLMNICMDVAVNPASGDVAVIGTDGTNERRFEPKLRGTFLRVNLALVDPLTLQSTIRDLNPHLDYSTSSVPVAVRDLSLGDPRGIVWNVAGTRAYVTGMGSRNLVVIDAQGNRAMRQPVELSEGPSGLALDETRDRLYVLNRFSASISVVDTTTLEVVTNVSFFDPTPPAIKIGRKHLYDTRRNSGLGQVSCGSCHVDARFDRLGWDLSNPAGPTIVNGMMFHPIKGPLVTQTLQDIFAYPNHGLHWRADRNGLEAFNPTFTDLLGADRQLSTEEMDEFINFVGTIHFPPNRFRNFDNSLPVNVPLPGFFGLGAEAQPDDTPLPNGNAVRGLELFNDTPSFRCASCHNLASGLGSGGDDALIQRFTSVFKVAQLRSIADRVGMDRVGTSSRAGFGFGFDGNADSLLRFLLSRDLLARNDNQNIADLTAFLLAFGGAGTQNQYATSQDAPAAVGRQVTLNSPQLTTRLNEMLALADLTANRVDLIARGTQDHLSRGWFYDRSTGEFQSDRNGEQIALNGLLALASAGAPLTFTVVPIGSARRLAVDRDDDNYFDRTESELGFNPTDSLSHGSNAPPQIALPPPIRVHPGMRVTHAFSAYNTDAEQTLTLTMTREMPPGSEFDPQSATFTWTPTAEQGDRIWHIGVTATDNGSPRLSVSTVLEISVVIPRIKRLLVGNDPDRVHGVVLDLEAVPDQYYFLQYKERLEDPAWTDVMNWSWGYAPEIRLYDFESFPWRPHRFYRVKVLDWPY